ncbi:MAG TPA: LacI family DNA-binding transcriptional regulator [Chryseosolibacter sp.]|nr:LacI family DNA-binding transcriptional regulator [Chryseosolibacter sp.]
MKKERPTIHDIARKLKITASTVSRALNDHPRISDVTKKAVRKTAMKLNYQPNHIAAALRNGKSQVLGVIVPTVDRTFFASVVRGVEEIANKSRYNVMICQTYDDSEKEIATVEALLNARVDGIIVSYAKQTVSFEHFQKVKEKGIPLIMFDRANDALNVSQVVIDDFLGAYEATTHLIAQGCQRIAHFTSRSRLSIYRERLRGYKEALTDHGLVYYEDLVLESNLLLEDGRFCMEQLMQKKLMPDAIFSASAHGAMGAMQLLIENGIRVPDQVAVVAFSNEPFTEFSEPALTTVDQHSIRMGNAVAEIFLDEISGGHKKFVPQKIVLKPELIIRKSSLRKSGRSLYIL